MIFIMAYYFATFVAILITHEAIFPITGQCTVQGCDNGDPLSSLVAEIQQLRVDLFDQLNKQVQSITELNASFREIKSQHTTVNMSLKALERCPHEHDIYIKQVKSIHELLNRSFQEIKSQHDTVNMSLQGVDRCPQEPDTYSKQFQGIHDILNQSFQEIKSHHDTVESSLQAVDQRFQEQDIYIRQVQSIHELFNESFQEMKSLHGTVLTSLQAVDQRRFQEQDIYIKQVQSIYELFNESFQEMKSLHGTVLTSLQSVDRRRLQEQEIYIKQGQSIYEFLNESFHEMKSQHGSVMTSLQAVDRRLQEHDITTKTRTQNLWKLANGICDAASPVCDCSNLKSSGLTTSGVYEVCVRHQLDQFCTKAFCDMETANGAHLVFQRRKDGSVNFNRTWTEYKQGFGNPNGEFWLGNEMLYLLTSKRNYKLRVDLEDFHGNKSFAEYTIFSISSSAENYTLTVSGYSGNAGDSLMSYHNGRQFTTKDVDNDIYKPRDFNCAQKYGGGWWFYSCFHSNLNGIYCHQYETTEQLTGIKWVHWHGWQYSLKATEMKLVPVA